MTARGAKPVAVDLFSGAGGMSLGFAQSGFSIAAAADSDPISAKTYSTNFPGVDHLCRDVAGLTAQDFRRQLGGKAPAVLFGGPPCQGFSLIGRRRPDDPRNRLVHHFFRLAVALGPKYIVMENVAGMLTKTSIGTLLSAIAPAREAGYEFLEPFRILNAYDFGVPQARRRLFVLAYRAGSRRPAYPVPSPGPRWSVGDAISDLARIPLTLETDVYCGPLGRPSAYSRTLARRPGDRPPRGAAGLTGCLATAHSGATVERFSGTRPGTYEQVSRLYRLRPDAPSATIRAGSDRAAGSFTAARPIHPSEPRCITVREAARIQGFPDWFAFHPTKWHGFRQVGNAVPPPLARAVAGQIIAALRGGDRRRS